MIVLLRFAKLALIQLLYNLQVVIYYKYHVDCNSLFGSVSKFATTVLNLPPILAPKVSGH